MESDWSQNLAALPSFFIYTNSFPVYFLHSFLLFLFVPFPSFLFFCVNFLHVLFIFNCWNLKIAKIFHLRRASATPLQAQQRSNRSSAPSAAHGQQSNTTTTINTVIHSPFTLMIIHSSVGSFRIIRTFALEWMEFLFKEMSKFFFSLRSKTATAPRISLRTDLNNMIGENEREIKRKKLI